MASIYISNRLRLDTIALNTGANIQQSGEAQVVVEDVLGNRTVQSFPVYVTTQLLKPRAERI